MLNGNFKMDGGAMKERIECDRFFIETLSMDELKQLFDGGGKLLPESVLTEEVKAAVSYKLAQMERLPQTAHPWVTYWRICRYADGSGMGLIGSKSLPDEGGYVELGYVMAKECQNRGYMTEAVTGFLDWLFARPFCNGARLFIRSKNFASLKTAEKSGFHYEGEEDGFLVYQYDFYC